MRGAVPIPPRWNPLHVTLEWERQAGVATRRRCHLELTAPDVLSDGRSSSATRRLQERSGRDRSTCSLLRPHAPTYTLGLREGPAVLSNMPPLSQGSTSPGPQGRSIKRRELPQGFLRRLLARAAGSHLGRTFPGSGTHRGSGCCTHAGSLSPTGALTPARHPPPTPKLRHFFPENSQQALGREAMKMKRGESSASKGGGGQGGPRNVGNAGR